MFYQCVRFRTMKSRSKLLDKMRRRSKWDCDATHQPLFAAKQLRLFSHAGRLFKKHSDCAIHRQYELTKAEMEWEQAMRKKLEEDPYEAIFGKRHESFWPWSRGSTGKHPRDHIRLVQANVIAADSKDPTPTMPASANATRHASQRLPKDATEDADAPNGQQTNYGYSTYDPITNRMVPADPPRDASRKAIHVPTASTTNDIKKTAVYFPSLLNTSIVPNNVKASTLSKATPRSENDLDKLTAEDVRANMGMRIQSRASFSTNSSSSAPPSSAHPPAAPPSSSPPSSGPRVWSFPLKESSKPSTKPYQPLQPAVERMQTKEYPTPSEPDDSAAHESTGDKIQPSAVPHNWDQQLDIAQSNRVSRTQGTSTDSDKSSVRELMRENAVLKAEVAANREYHAKSQRKIKEMKDRIDEAYKQSTVSSSMHVDRIREIENSLANAQTKSSAKVKDLKNELEQAHKQNSINMDMQMERIRILESALAKAKANKVQPAEFTQAEGDFDAANVAKFAKAGRWYKQQSSGPAVVTTKDAGLDKYLAEHEKRVGDRWQFKPEHTDQLLAEQAAREKEISDWNAGKRSTDEDLNNLAAYERRVGDKYAFKPEHTDQLRAEQAARDKEWKDWQAGKRLSDEDLKCLAEYESRVGDKFRFSRQETESYLRDQKKQDEMIAASEAQKKADKLRGEQAVAEVEEDEKCLREYEKTHPNKYQFCKKETESLVKDIKQQDKLAAECDAKSKAAKLREEAAIAELAATKKCLDEYDQAHPNKYKFDKSQTEELVKEIQQQDKLIAENEARIKAEKLAEEQAAADLTATEKELEQYDQAHPEKYEFNPAETDALLDEIKKQDQIIAEHEAKIAAEKLAAEEAAAEIATTNKKLQEYDDAHPSKPFDPAETDKLLEEIKNPEQMVAGNITRQTETMDTTSQWEQPPVYKILAYDSGNDFFSTATTSSNITNRESAISIPDALSKLYQPARFLPHFAELQQNGYQVIHGSKDFLVFKKLKESADGEASLVDHGLFKTTDTQAEPLTNLVEPLASGKTGGAAVNPIDGTVRVESDVASYASPTGFVGDRWADIMSHAGKPTIHNEDRNGGQSDDANDTEIKHFPRVRREERVFSGRKKARGSRYEYASSNEENLRRKYGWGSRIRWALTVGLGASAVAYGVGAAVERKELKEKERWEQLMKANNRRW
jgi:hypothetical protein